MVENKIHIEVVYATEARQVIIALDVPVGHTVFNAIADSGICEQFPEIDL
ncbi:unnamed protein product, partial [marine sediment metagenome]